MHPVIRLCPTISLLSEAWGYITGVKPPGIGPARVTSCKDGVTMISEGLSTRVGKALKTNAVAARCKAKRLRALTVLSGQHPKYACAFAA